MAHLYTLDIEDAGMTDEMFPKVVQHVTKQLAQMEKDIAEERVYIDKLNELVQENLFDKVDSIIKRYQGMVRTCRKRCRHCSCDDSSDDGSNEDDEDDLDKLTRKMGKEIGELLPQEEAGWFSDKYEFAHGPMLDLRMKDATIMIMKVYHWCAYCSPAGDAWDDLIPYYLARNVKELRKCCF
jgi:hypothetical protein